MATPSKFKKSLVPLVFTLSLLFTAAGAILLVLTSLSAEEDQEFIAAVQEQATMAEAIAHAADQAQDGDRDAFVVLQQSSSRLENLLNRTLGMAAGKDAVSTQAGLVRDAWAAGSDGVAAILESRDTVIVGHAALASAEEAMPVVLGQAENIQSSLLQSGSSDQLYHIGRFGTFSQRALKNAHTLLHGGGDMDQADTDLESEIDYLDRVLRGLSEGDPGLEPALSAGSNAVSAAARQALQSYGAVSDDLVDISSASQVLTNVDAARFLVQAQMMEVATEAVRLRQAYNDYMASRPVQPLYGYIGLGVGLFFLIMLVVAWNVTYDVRAEAEAQEEMQRKNEEAILRLLDELGSLADGDLTVQVTVTEDITGAIADSINYAIEALRDLVVTINDTALQVDTAAQNTRSITAGLAQASEQQATQITTATQAINTMANSIEQVSSNAERSAKVAQQSVDIAHKGGEAVRRTIAGMNTIRETIQETSKRIKRLGESSQEIGDIVELINDIAEQTNILALNASIQASMAGEAGRGFAVVADEVQRLAERAGNATRQIEALVQTIQSDTNEAVSSMERSTSDVVQGAQLAENAGRALDEIEKVSNHIATLVQSISNAARQQAGQATEVSKTMNVIQDITHQTAEGTQETAASVGELVSLAAELRKSVSGFKLPGPKAPGTEVLEPEEVSAMMESGSEAGADDEAVAEA